MAAHVIPETPIPLWAGETPGYDPDFGQPIPTLTPYILPEARGHGLVVVLPGGGYMVKAPHEGEPVAHWLNQVDVSAVVVEYRVSPYRHPIPLLDARRAIQLARSRADAWGIDPTHIGLLGFSAGGHLASTVGTHLDDTASPVGDPVSQCSSRPDALILCYPVISFGSFGHAGSKLNLLGEGAPNDLVAALCNETQVSGATPPTFLWHTANDDGVPVSNSLAFATALGEHGVPYELHVFPEGAHGLGLAQDHPQVSQWTGLCATWLRGLGFM
jgi:acetyl esterase/lipase